MNLRQVSIVWFGLIFILCFSLGQLMSQHKPLWNDEIFTQVEEIDKRSYQDILLFKSKEGNRSPLFYLIQKVISDLSGFRLSYEWVPQQSIKDPHAQATMRFSSNLFTCLSISLIFLYFAYRYSWWAGFLSLLMTLSSYVFWLYWVDARPYSLWIFLSVCQAFLLIELQRSSVHKKKLWFALMIVHILLSVTVFVSMMQIVVASMLLWFFKDRNWTHYLWLMGAPCFLNAIVFLNTPNYGFWFAGSMFGMIHANFPVERAALLGIFIGIFVFLKRFKNINADIQKDWQIIVTIFWFTGIMLALGVVMVVLLKYLENGQGSCVHLRHWIFLAPIAVIASTLGCIYTWRQFQHHIFLRAVLYCLIGGVLFAGFWKLYQFSLLHLL